ncbi:hypothetical protein [Piscinibacter gummiphilus]|uniref:Transcriptional regulator n=1 Tax=Piscinibacter gummiphilus TaxID=946333 RepID=A0ABZ0D2A2_9BURK|nr:hypothetical protein [Piscinibacter gummiphilus]WOB11318.1 hypothetical protein RXV79_27935 [Piscinibacter gummiphilus]
MNTDLLSLEELSTQEMATRMGIDADELSCREQAGDLFSYVKPRRSSERMYPAYQLAPEIYPELLRTAMEVLGTDGPLLETFFSWRDRDLGGLNVREVLAGRPFEGFEPDEEAAWLLSLPAPRRKEAVMGALERMRAVAQDWG